LAGEIKDGNKVIVDFMGGEFTFSTKPAERVEAVGSGG
jgi:hypothetical protein